MMEEVSLASHLPSVVYASLQIILPPRISRSAEYERIFELEHKLGSRPEYAAVARYTQCFARLA